MPETTNDIRKTLGISDEVEQELKERVNNHFINALETQEGVLQITDVLLDFSSDTQLTRTEIAYVSYQLGRIIEGNERRYQ